MRNFVLFRVSQQAKRNHPKRHLAHFSIDVLKLRVLDSFFLKAFSGRLFYEGSIGKIFKRVSQPTKNDLLIFFLVVPAWKYYFPFIERGNLLSFPFLYNQFQQPDNLVQTVVNYVCTPELLKLSSIMPWWSDDMYSLLMALSMLLDANF